MAVSLLFVAEAEDVTVAKDNPERRIVQPNSEGGWDVTARDARRASTHADTQAEAIDRARQIVERLGGGEVEIRRRNGVIRDVDTVGRGHDPHPPRDRR